jgi:excisionase family DNA binding protein
MLLDEAALRALIEEVVRKVVREEAVPGVAAQEHYVSVAEAARRIDVASATIREWIQQGRLGRYHAGRELRVRLSELQALVTQGGRKTEPTPEEAAREFLARRRASAGPSR